MAHEIKITAWRIQENARPHALHEALQIGAEVGCFVERGSFARRRLAVLGNSAPYLAAVDAIEPRPAIRLSQDGFIFKRPGKPAQAIPCELELSMSLQDACEHGGDANVAVWAKQVGGAAAKRCLCVGHPA